MKNLSGVGCLFLFFTPFAGTSIWASYEILTHVNKSVEVSSWEEVPAKVNRVYAGEKSSGDDGTTHYIEGQYSYRYNGRVYTSDKVAIEQEGGFGITFNRWEKETKEAKSRGEEILCRVNPENPGEAILFTEINWDVLFFWFIFAGAFGLVGFGGMGAALYGLKILKREDALKDKFPSEPWKWNENWHNNSIPANSGAKVIAFWCFAILWNLISAPIIFILPGELAKENYLVLIGLLFPLVGLGLFIMALRASIQKKKFGESKFVLETLPGVIGGRLQGDIHFATPMQIQDKLALILSCKQTTGSGDNRRERTIWQSEKSIGRERIGGGHIGGLPVSFSIPYSCLPTSDEDDVKWTLDTSAELPGVDFEAQFIVPVFKTNDSNPNLTEEEEEEFDFSRIESVPDSKILVNDLPTGGKEIVVPPLVIRSTGMAVGMLVFTVVWVAISIGLGFSDAPILFPIVFGLFGLLFLSISTLMFFRRTEIKVDIKGIERKTQGLLFRSEKYYRKENIEDVKADVTSTTTSGNKSTLHYGLKLKTLIGSAAKEVELIWIVGDKKTAYYFIQLIEEALGLEKKAKKETEEGPWVG